MKMELKEALRIVLELAEGNMVDSSDVPEEAARQGAAIEAVRTHLEAQ